MPYNRPSYPQNLWNGLTKNPDRVDLHSNVNPNADDWEKIAAEVMSMQSHTEGVLLPLITSDGEVSVTDDEGNVQPLTTSATIYIDASSGARSIDLPVPSQVEEQTLLLKKVDGTTNLVTITPLSGTIDGQASVKLTSPFQYIRLKSNGTGYYVMAETPDNGGIEVTGGFTDRTTGLSGQSDIGSNRDYTSADVTANRWMLFGIDPTSQANNDAIYWTDPDSANDPAYTASKGLFGGTLLPTGSQSFFDFNSTALNTAGTLSNGEAYSAATGSLDLSTMKLGDKLEVRFDFNVRPQVANTNVEVALIFFNRDASDTVTFKFALTTTLLTFGSATVGKTLLTRPQMTAWIAQAEDINGVCLPAIRSDNPVQIQPLTMFASVQR